MSNFHIEGFCHALVPLECPHGFWLARIILVHWWIFKCQAQCHCLPLSKEEEYPLACMFTAKKNVFTKNMYNFVLLPQC